jgi:FkbM family methyltransferase
MTLPASRPKFDALNVPLKALCHIVQRIRPAPLGSAIADLSGLSKRRMVRTSHGTFFLNPASNFGYSLIFKDYEPSMRAALQKYLSPGAVFIDLGANEAYFSVLASRLVGPNGTVITVEPQSRLQSVIQTNLSLNECSNVTLLQAVVSSTTGTANIHLTPDVNSGGTSLFRTTKYPLKTETVPSFSMSDFLSRTHVTRCDLIKVDVEGAEYDILMAAEQVLKAGILRNIALEIHNSILETKGLSGSRLHDWMLSCGYKLNNDLGPWIYTATGA